MRDAADAGVPTLGVCFGGQLLAQAFGGSVARSATPEIGWYDVTSDDEILVPGGPWFQWHFDGWTLPPGATEIARTANSSQAFLLGRALGLQFHPELDHDLLARWLGRRPRRRGRRRRPQPRRTALGYNGTRPTVRPAASAAWCGDSCRGWPVSRVPVDAPTRPQPGRAGTDDPARSAWSAPPAGRPRRVRGRPDRLTAAADRTTAPAAALGGEAHPQAPSCIRCCAPVQARPR